MKSSTRARARETTVRFFSASDPFRVRRLLTDTTLCADEPYVPDWDEPDYKTAGIGAALRAIPWGKLGDVDEWLQQEELERRMFKATLDDEIPAPACELQT